MTDLEEGELPISEEDDSEEEGEAKVVVMKNNNSKRYEMKSSNFRTKVCEFFKKGKDH